METANFDEPDDEDRRVALVCMIAGGVALAVDACGASAMVFAAGAVMTLRSGSR